MSEEKDDNLKQEKKAELEELYFLRALAIIGVLLVHATANAAVEMGTSALHPVYVFLNRFGKVGTPTFVFLSSLVLFYNYYHRPFTGELVRRFYQRRLKLIIAPYLLWSLIYYLSVVYVLNQGFAGFWSAFSLAEFGDKVLTGNAYYHLYFVIISIQFYLVFPAVLYLLKKFSGTTPYLIWIGLAGQWIFYLFNRNGWQLSDTSSIALNYFSYFMLGAFIGIYYSRFYSWISEERISFLGVSVPTSFSVITVWLLAGLAYFYIYLLGFGQNIWYDSFWYSLGYNVYTGISGIALIYFAILIQRRSGTKLKKLLQQIGAYSFGIYLVHPLLLWIWQKLTVTSNPTLYHLAVVGGFVLILTVPWLIVSRVQRYLPFSWMIFGQKRKKRSKGQNGYFFGRNPRLDVERKY